MQIQERTYSPDSNSYRFGFQGQEGDIELSEDGNYLAFNYRIHDTKLGRFLSTDPLSGEYPWNSTYAFAENRAIDGIDLDGAEHVPTDEIWDIEQVPVLMSSRGSLSEAYSLTAIGGKPYFMFYFEDGRNKGNSLAVPMKVGSGPKYIIGKDRVGEFQMKRFEGTEVAVGSKYKMYKNALSLGTFKYLDYEQPDFSEFNVGEYLADQWTDPENLLMVVDIASIRLKPKGLGNQFKYKTLDEVAETFENQVKQGKMIKAGPSPVSGKGAYINNKSGYSYHLDKGGSYGKGSKKVEEPHVDVNYPNPKTKDIPSKKKLSVKN